ncbi:MerR family transcriptional regulator [uncultured Microbacterium sp.]|uniref:MerR family transcriptional regulator n=2 Tax=uncultured Microbacterium sp. TaxID=191216 RepID=A0A1Y5NZ62_9MICO|nr:MerR family transcriptional regulator [uncultured Microbacterium sp.]
MYTIGEFAAHGRVSVRMLRHYDAIGLLRPARVDEHSGYRHYEPSQLGGLLRIVELRDLGCSLEDAAAVLGAADEDDALRAVLLRRRAELEASLAADEARLARLTSRLSTLEGEPPMSALVFRSLDPVTVYAARGTAPGMGPENVTPVIDRILPPLEAALSESGVDYREPGIFWYEPIEGTEDLGVNVSWIAGDDPQPGQGWEVVELPGAERVAVWTYAGDMPGIGRAWHEFMVAMDAAGCEPIGPSREVYLVADGPQTEWVTELQQPVR